jgi:hypothetical protein
MFAPKMLAAPGQSVARNMGSAGGDKGVLDGVVDLGAVFLGETDGRL